MATELGQAYIQIMPSAKGISGTIKGILGPEVDSAGQSAGAGLGKSLVTAVTGVIAAAGIGKLFSASLTEGAALQQSLGGIETLFKGSADTVKNYANQAYRTAGVSANKYMENVTSFSASLISSLGGDTAAAAELANTAMVDMSDNANKMGTDMESITQTYQSLARGNYAMLDNLKLGYGGTKSEMERLMADAEKLTGEHYTVGDFADTVKAIHAVQESLGITGTTAKEASTTLSGSMAAMKAAFSDVLGKLSLGQDIGPSLQGLAEATSTFLFGNFIPMVGNILQGLPSAILTFIQAAMPQFQAGLQGLFSSLGINLDLSSLTSKFQGITTTIQPVIDGLQTAFSQLPALFQSVLSAVTPVIDTLVTGFTQMDFSGIQSLISAILPALQAGFESFMSVAGSAIDQVVQSFVSLWNAIQPLISILSEALMPVFEILGSFLGSVLAGKLSSISGLFDLLKMAIEFVTPVVQFLVDGLNQLQPIFSWIGEKVGFLIGMFGNLGAASEGLGSFVRSSWENIQNAIKVAADFIDNAISIIKTVFTNVGQAADTVRGIISTAWEAIRQVISTVGEVIGNVIQTASSSFTGFANVVSDVGNSVGGVINTVIDTIRGIANIDISGAGAAIMNGFLNGLKSAWGSVTSFVGGIADWIAKHKGPISYDRKLLIPAGRAIMGGLNSSLQENFKTVQATISGMAGSIVDQFGEDVIKTSLESMIPSSDIQTSMSMDSLFQNNEGASVSNLERKLSALEVLLQALVDKDVDVYLDGEKIAQNSYNRQARIMLREGI